MVAPALVYGPHVRGVYQENLRIAVIVVKFGGVSYCREERSFCRGHGVLSLDRQQLLDRVNRCAKPRYGIGVTPRMLQDWVAEKLVSGPVAHGQRRGEPPYWEWSRDSYRRILQICRLKGRGANRVTQIRCGLWLRGVDLPFEAVQAAMHSEFQRAKKLALRSVASTWDPRQTPNLTSGRQAALAREMGEPSPLLLPTGCLFPNELSPDVYATLRFGMNDPDGAHKMVEGLLSVMGLGSWVTPDFIDFAYAHRWMIVGTLGSADEIAASAEVSITEASAETFTNIRDWCRAFSWLLQNASSAISFLPPAFADGIRGLVPPAAQVAKLIRPGPWQVPIFAMFLHYAHNSDKGHALGQCARHVVPPLRRIVAQCRHNPELHNVIGDQNPFVLLTLLPRPWRELNEDQRSIRRRLRKLLWPHGLADLNRFFGEPKNRGLSL